MNRNEIHRQLSLFEGSSRYEEEDKLLEENDRNTGPKYEDVQRILHLLSLLESNDCTRRGIFERIGNYYDDGINSNDVPSQAARKKLERDIKFLVREGYRINKTGRGMDTVYRLARGINPSLTFFFNQDEVNTLSRLHTLFALPTVQALDNPGSTTPQQSYRNPFAEDILELISRFVATLPTDQKRYFDRLIQRPPIYLNLNTVVDYHPHRATIEKLIQAIWFGRRIRFIYSPGYRQQDTKHDEVDPHYIVHQDGHFYLLGYSYKMGNFFELRVDRIAVASIELRNEPINRMRSRRAIEFRYWADARLVKGDLSQRWLTCEIERRDVYLKDEQGQRIGAIIKATAYSEWRIIQQLHKYGDKVRLLDPPKLCERMEAEVERMYLMYKSGQILT